MIEMRRTQLSFGEGLIAAEIEGLCEPWMVHADAVLADEQLMTTVYEALAKRRPKSRSRGRRATPAEVVLRLLVLKHIRNWSYQARLGRTPRLVAANAAFYSAKNEMAVKAKGVKRVCIPNRSTKSPERKREQKKRWFRNGQKWRTGCEGRISVIKRRHGLSRCRYKGDAGMKRWVGLGVIADNLINIGHAMEKQLHT